MSIDPRAAVSAKAHLGEGVEVGPFAVIEDGVTLGARVKVWPHAYICTGTTVGDDTQIHMGAVVGHAPQDLAFAGKPSFLTIGKRTVVREYATIHRGTEENSSTVIGDDCYFMATAHVGHNCQIGNKVIVVNAALLAGYVTVEDGAFISGNVVIHQFCRIGTMVMVGGYTAVNKDVPPYMLVRGPSVVRSLNLIGLRRAKFSRELIADLKEAFRLLYLADLNTQQALEGIAKLRQSPELDHLSAFIRSSKRGICKSKDTEEEYWG